MGILVKDLFILSTGLLPQNLLSFLVGVLARVRLPKALQGHFNQFFVSIFKINMSESLQTLDSFASVEEVFTRALRPGLRPIGGDYVSSADGTLEVSRAASSSKEGIQAKGRTYSLSELVFGTLESSPDFKPAWFTTVYLAPYNYHRVHAPFAGKIHKIRYLPGVLWPVNKPAVRRINRLFCKNERLVFDFEVAGGGKGWLVMVGALNVGRMVTPLDPDLVTNSAKRVLTCTDRICEKVFAHPVHLNGGDEVGTFMLGSTTVVVLDEVAVEVLKPKEITEPSTVQMGQNLSGLMP